MIGVPDVGAQDYLVTNLGSLGGAETYVADVNDLGQVVGRSFTSGFSDMRAFLWENGDMTNLGTLGGDESEAWAINNNGLVVGISENGSGHNRAFLWDNGFMFDLGTLGGDESGALGINDKDQVVGYAETGENDPNGFPIRHAVVWENGQIRDLGTYQNDTHSYAYDINLYGVACGYSDDGPGGAFVRHPVRFIGASVEHLGSLGGTFGHSWGINDAGEISGDSYLVGNIESRAFKWKNGVMMNVGTLNDSYSLALDINAFGQMCGVSPGGFLPQAVRWVGNDIIQNINNFTPPGTNTMDAAEGVNGIGQVVTEDTSQDAYLLTPPVTQIVLYGPDPGRAAQNNEFRVYGAAPGATVRLYWALQPGSTAVPGCPGLDLDMRNVRLGAIMTADGLGRADVTGFTSSGARGRVVYYQAIEYAQCKTSNLVAYRY